MGSLDEVAYFTERSRGLFPHFVGRVNCGARVVRLEWENATATQRTGSFHATRSVIVGNQQEWHTLESERSWLGWKASELPEGPVVLSPPFDGLGLRLPPPSQYIFSPSSEHVWPIHFPQRLVIAPVAVVAAVSPQGQWGRSREYAEILPGTP